MSDMNTKAVTFSVVLIIHYCYNVDIDYYSDNNKDFADNETETDADARRIGEDGSLDSDTTKNVTLLASAKDVTDNYWTTSTITIEAAEDEPDSNSEEDDMMNITQIPIMSVFEDYVYEYADDGKSSTENYDGYQEKTVSDNQEKNSLMHNNSNLSSIDLLKGGNTSSKIRNSDLFHIEPAVKKINLKKHPQMLKLSNVDNVWYVPESYPCWKLPLLFGRLKKRAKVSEVFYLQGGILGDIKHEPEPDDSAITVRNLVGDSRNKWCDQGPCYGDHTLCVFSNDTISRICDNSYKVKKLSVPDQMTVINTINTMRNSVAMGTTEVYPQLPTASNMQQIMYDADLALISDRWLRQCLPGPAVCSSLNNKLVTQLECHKSFYSCCTTDKNLKKCIPPNECFVPALIGCLHAWFLSAGDDIKKRDVDCAHITRKTMNTAQILWANTEKIGCAYAVRDKGQMRVICNFSPGATFYLTTKYYCGIIPHKDITENFEEILSSDITDLNFMESLGIQLNKTHLLTPKLWRKSFLPPSSYLSRWGVSSLNEMLKENAFRQYENNEDNGTVGAVARLVTKYSFYDDSNAKCDSDESIYQIGPPGSECEETGRIFKALCYIYRDPSPGYRLAAIVAPVALFSLILYDLFSGVVRQTNF